MHAYNAKDLERLFGLPASAVRSLARAGHINPVKRSGRLHYSFEDLLMMRTASALRAANISAQRINRTLSTFRATLPEGSTMNVRSLTALGDQIAVREGKLLWETESGQYALALDSDVQNGGVHVIKRPAASVPAGDPTQLAGDPTRPAGNSAQSAGDLADTHYARAFALEETDPDGARRAYEASLAADPNHVEATINLGRLLHSAGRLEEAERLYSAAPQTEPMLVFNRAVLLEDLNRESEAMMAYRQVLALDPQFADAHFNLARLYEGAGDPKSSLRHLLAYRRMTSRQGN